MSDDRDNGSMLTISGLVVILSIFGLPYLFPSSFKSLRPAEPKVPALQGKVDARLWQDPFLAVIKGAKRAEPASRPRGAADASRTVLGVMVPVSPYPGDFESRLRIRYAILSGLVALGYAPDDPLHLKYYTWPPQKNSNAARLASSDLLPCETFTTKESGRGAVEVVWINDDKAGEVGPLSFLASLIPYIGAEKDHFVLIGPASSPTLEKMIEEATANPSLSNISGVRIYNAMATIPDKELLIGHTGKGWVREILGNQHITYKPTVPSDDVLINLLVGELKLRMGGNFKKSDQIVLISEWDTNYGRLLPEMFKNSFQEAKGDKDSVHVYSYLRGIDGFVPKDSEEKDGQEENKDTSGAASNPLEQSKKLEQPVGRSQYDYLRRLSRHVHDSWQHEPKSSVKAIGVLGSDFFDKYLVLQAFHEQFPEAIYFTTDLDASYLHPEALKWTRNLVVASHFDLLLKDEAILVDETLHSRRGIPPFRDNYQTSLFYATLKAFNAANPGLSPKPLIFEIGRHTAVKLSPDDDHDVNPKRHCEWPKGVIRLVAFSVSVLLCLLLITSTTFAAFFERYRIYLVCALAALAGTIYFFHVKIYERLEVEEPFSLFEGISIWPTEIIRVIACICAVLMIIKSSKALRRNALEIFEKYRLEKLEVKMDNVAPRFLNLIFKRRKGSLKDFAVDWISIDDYWAEYEQRELPPHKRKRVAAMVVLYLVFSSSLFLLFGFPNTPVRGGLSSFLNHGILTVCGLAFTVLIFYVLDATRSLRIFIDKVAKRGPAWSSRSVCQFATGCEGESPPISEWMFVKLVAERTDAVGRLIYYPFVVWFLMIISRIHYFANLHYNISLIIGFTTSAVIAWGCALSLRYAAERAKDSAVGRLKGRILLTCQLNKEETDRIKAILHELEEIREGAYLPFLQHPLVRALILPFSGVGGSFLIELLEKTSF